MPTLHNLALAIGTVCLTSSRSIGPVPAHICFNAMPAYNHARSFPRPNMHPLACMRVLDWRLPFHCLLSIVDNRLASSWPAILGPCLSSLCANPWFVDACYQQHTLGGTPLARVAARFVRNQTISQRRAPGGYLRVGAIACNHLWFKANFKTNPLLNQR